MGRFRVAFTFDAADQAAVRNVADAFRDGLRRAQAAGRYQGVRLEQGPSVASSWPEPTLPVADYLARSEVR